MATLAFKPYTYVPTPPRSKSTATRRRPAPEQVSILDKLQQIRSSSALLNTPRPVAAAAAAMPVANGNGGYKPGIRGTSTVYGGSDKENDDEINDDGRDLPTVEKLLLTKLQEQGFAAADPNPGHKERGVEEAAADERGGAIDRHGSVPGDNFGGSPEDPMVLQGDGDSSASEAEVNDNALRAESAAAPGAGLFDNPETAIDSMTPAPPCSSDGWHDIDDFLETAPRLPLAEQGASTSNSIHAAPSPLSSEPLHDSIGAVDLHPHRARSEATTYARPRSPPPRCARASPPKNQLSQEDHLHTGRSVADEHRLVGPVRNADPVDERERRQQEEAEDNDEDASSKSEHPPSLQGASVGKCRPLRENSVVLGMEAIEQPQADPDLLDWEADSMAPMQLEVWPRGSARELSQAINEAGCDSHSGDELNNTESDEDDGKPRPIKRKRPSSSQDGPMHKKPKPRLQQRSTGQHRPRSKPHKRSPKSHPPPDQTSRVAAVPSPQARPSAPHATDTDMSPDCYNLNRSSRAALPTLTEVTFRPHSPHCCSFTAVIRDGSAERGVSFGQLAQLIASIGHVGKIDDFSIKPMEQHSFLLTGFSWHTPSRPSSSGTTLSTAAEAGRDHVNAMRTRPQEGRAVDARALASRRSKPSISDDDSGLSDSDSESSSDDDECSSEGEQGRSSTSKHSRWPDLDEQRLLAYKKEDKSWKWIFRKFPGRTRPAIRTRWNMIRPRGE